ncbi:hypothetical protein [Candidatus Tisiphia endosymbiont of Hybos culiciformis]|uniref:hypothetical protein n=1 Tax=Candidatus Tisiphia endosymbiont of Hybos culiciformis TaxID=3139331 RepID=UPI003CCB4B94
MRGATLVVTKQSIFMLTLRKQVSRFPPLLRMTSFSFKLEQILNYKEILNDLYYW